MSINESSMWAAVHRMESASEQMARAAEEITQAVQRFAFLLEPGYGGNGLRLIELLEQAAPQELRIVLDGPPGPEAGRFVEVENAAGRSVNAGEWRERADGLWELVLHATQGGE